MQNCSIISPLCRTFLKQVEDFDSVLTTECVVCVIIKYKLTSPIESIPSAGSHVLSPQVTNYLHVILYIDYKYLAFKHISKHQLWVKRTCRVSYYWILPFAIQLLLELQKLKWDAN